MSRISIYLGIMAMVLLSICGPARGADTSGDSNCINAIIPCANYLNATKPPSLCCDPLVKVYNTDKACLCSLLNQTDLIKQFNVNITQALQLPIHCGLDASTSACSNLGGNSTSSGLIGSPPPPSTSSSESAASSPSFETLPLLAVLLFGVAAQVYQ